MDRYDPYERHYQDIRDENYWEDRRQDIKNDYEFASKYRDFSIQRDISLRRKEDGRSKAFDELLEERSNCGRLIRGFTWLPKSAQDAWWDKLYSIDLVKDPSVLKDLESLTQEIREHKRFLEGYGKTLEVIAVGLALLSLSRMSSLYIYYK
jgi:hypothetical protein